MAPRIFDVRPGEGAVVVPALAFAFLCVGAQTLAAIASDSLFVSAFDLGALSRFYLVSAILRVAVSLSYGALSVRYDGPRFDALFLVATAGSVAVFYPAAISSSHTALYSACVALVLLPSLLALVAIGTALDCFHARQARRILPLVAAAATAGAIVMGGTAKLAAHALGTPALILFAAAVALMAVPLPTIIAKRAARLNGVPEALPIRTDPPSAWESIAGGFSDMKSVLVVRIFALNALLASAMAVFVDYAFKAALKAHYARDEMAGFLGVFNLVTEAAVLGVQLFLTTRLVGWLGIRRAIRARPGLLVPLSALIAVVPGTLSATATKLVEMLVRLSVGGTVSDLLLAPTPPAVRSRAKMLGKAVAFPLGALLAGSILAVFGADGPGAKTLGVIIGASALFSVVLLSPAGSAYTNALAKAIRSRDAKLEVSPESAGAFREEMGRLVRDAIAQRDDRRIEATLNAGADLLSLDDLALLGGRSDELARSAARAAIRAARRGEGDKLWTSFPSSEDDDLERAILARCRQLGGSVDGERLARAQQRGEEAPHDELRARLFEEAIRGLVPTGRDEARRALARAASSSDSPLRAAALRALADLEPRASLELFSLAMESSDRSVFYEAARGAVLGGMDGVVPGLVHELARGSHAQAASRALALTGKQAVVELLAMLSKVDANRAHPAFSIADTVRAARVLSRLGPEACEGALEKISTLGFRPANAVIHALASARRVSSEPMDTRLVAAGMEQTLCRVESLVRVYPALGSGLARREIERRVGEVADRMLDLAAVLGDRKLIARARAGLRGDVRTRGNALELLENILPRAVATRTVALFEWAPTAAVSTGKPDKNALDEWLTLCKRFDSGTLEQTDPMLPVLERLTILRASSLFAGLAGEELYPVAEIAETVTCRAGQSVVKEGDPGDAVFVVVSGTLVVSRENTRLREIERGATFGEMALLDGSPRSARIEATTDAELLRIPREEFEGLLDESPELAKGVIRTLLNHLRGTG